jgi:CheY-like chemotaxis protein
MNDRSKTILVMDDSEIVLELVRAELEAEGFAVRCAGDREALERESSAPGSIDLVLMDVQMPELFGNEVAVVLREEYGVRCPIYLFSSLENSELEERVKQAGVSGYISKRDGMDALVDRVIEIVAATPG